MSYSLDVKMQLLTAECPDCCRRAELYGFLLFSNTVTPTEIRIVTAYPQVRARYLNFLMQAGVRNFELFCQGSVARKYVCRIVSSSDLSVLRAYLCGVSFESPLRIDAELLRSDCCKRAFLRGAFMANGVIVSPEKNCSVEFRTSHLQLGSDFFRFCQKDLELLPGTSMRNGKKLIYFKSWDSVKDVLLLIGAKDAAYDLANSEIVRSCRSTANRRYNCDNANIQRQLDAATEQIEAIRTLHRRGTELPAALEEIARLRAEYPDETLTRLGQRCVPPISKAGAAHRLKKIMEIAARGKGE